MGAIFSSVFRDVGGNRWRRTYSSGFHQRSREYMLRTWDCCGIWGIQIEKRAG